MSDPPPPRSRPAAGGAVPGSTGAGPLVLVPAGARFEGVLAFRGAVRVEGCVHGPVVARGSLEIGPEAEVVGDVEVDTLRVAGHLEGDAFARERVDLEAGAHVEGAVRAPVVVVADGCRLDGSLAMGAAPGAADAAARSGAGGPPQAPQNAS